MSESLLNDFVAFFDALPASVRDDLSFMMVMLSDEDLVVHDLEATYAGAARELFQAQTRIGRIANLIGAVSVFDVYFAMDERMRFDPEGDARQRRALGGRNVNAPHLFDRYAERIGAIQAARLRWQELRLTKLSPVVIAAALIPPDASTKPHSQRAASPSISMAD